MELKKTGREKNLCNICSQLHVTQHSQSGNFNQFVELPDNTLK
jgi:hypothetical protein